MLKNFTLSLFFILLYALPAYAQLEMTNYYAIDLSSQQHDDIDWTVFQMHRQGVVLMRKEEKGFGKTRRIEFTHLDTTLQIKFVESFTLLSAFDRHVMWQDDQSHNIYGLAQEAEYSKKFQFFHLDLAGKKGNEYQAEFPFTFEVHSFQVSQQTAYIAGMSNDKWVVVSFNLLDKSMKLLPHFFEDREAIKGIHLDSTRHELLFTIANTDYRNRKMYIQPYSSLVGGNKRIELKGRSREVRKRTFMEAIAFHPDKQKNDIWTIGTYSLEGQQFWQGLFMTKLVGDEQNLSFYRFQDFSHFFKHLPPRRRQKMEDKMSQYNQKDKEYIFGRRIFWNPKLIETPTYYVLMLTGYHQQHPNQNSAMWQSANGRFPNSPYNPYYAQTRFPTQNDNLAYTYDYAALVGFDKQTGRLVWDNMMKIEEIEQQNPQKIVQTAIKGDSVITAYIKEDKIYSQICYKREMPIAPQEQETKYVLDGKLVEKIEDAELHTWHDGYFLMTGTFKRMQVAEGMSKYVFYCARLRYNPPKEDKKAKNDKK